MTGLIIASAAAQEIRGTPYCSAIGITAIVDPLLDGPITAQTLSRVISFLIARTDLPSSPAVSSTIICKGWPFMPPCLFICSSIILTVFLSGSPSQEAGPVIEKIAPTL